MAMSRRLYLILAATSSKHRASAMASADDWRRVAEDDFINDSAGKDYLSRADFDRCWFQLADLHTKTVDAETYAAWVDNHIEAIAARRLVSTKGSKAKAWVWEYRNDRVILSRGLSVKTETKRPNSTKPISVSGANGKSKSNVASRLRSKISRFRMLWESEFKAEHDAEKFEKMRRRQQEVFDSLRPSRSTRASSARSSGAGSTMNGSSRRSTRLDRIPDDDATKAKPPAKKGSPLFQRGPATCPYITRPNLRPLSPLFKSSPQRDGSTPAGTPPQAQQEPVALPEVATSDEEMHNDAAANPSLWQAASRRWSKLSTRSASASPTKVSTHSRSASTSPTKVDRSSMTAMDRIAARYPDLATAMDRLRRSFQ